jgi:predicted ATP-grasp superfamily ATP-dependent carboligase
MKPAIILGTHTMGLGVIRALGSMRVPIIAVYYNPNDMGYVSKYVSEVIRAPHPEYCEEEFIALLESLAARFAGSPIFPVSDESLKLVSRRKARLEKNFLVACTDWEITQQLIEKNYTYAVAESIGVPAPRTAFPQSLEEAAQFGERLLFPCLVKPVESHLYFDRFKKKMARVEDMDGLLEAYNQAAAAGLQVVLQEFIPGEDSLGVNYNSYFLDGKPVAEFTAQKIRSAPPELGSPCVAKSQVIPEVMAAGRRVLNRMGYYGYSCMEFKCDPRDGAYKLMEVNGRHNLSTLLAVKSGINFPWIHYQHLTQEVLPQGCTYGEGVYWIDFERDLAYFSQRLFDKREPLSQLVKPYLKPHVYAVFDSRDLQPFLKRYISFAKKGYSGIWHKSASNSHLSDGNN